MLIETKALLLAEQSRFSEVLAGVYKNRRCLVPFALLSFPVTYLTTPCLSQAGPAQSCSFP